MQTHLSPAAARLSFRLARYFGHGWVDFASMFGHRSFPEHVEQTFVDSVNSLGYIGACAVVTARMEVWESLTGTDQGIRPVTSHCSGSGRYSWHFENKGWWLGDDWFDEETLYFSVNRPCGMVCKATVDIRTMTAQIEVLHGCEDRHEEYMREVLGAIGVEIEWTDREPVQYGESVLLPRKAMKDPVLFDLALAG